MANSSHLKSLEAEFCCVRPCRLKHGGLFLVFLANTDCEIVFVLRLICKSLGSQWGPERLCIFVRSWDAHWKPGPPPLSAPLSAEADSTSSPLPAQGCGCQHSPSGKPVVTVLHALSSLLQRGSRSRVYTAWFLFCFALRDFLWFPQSQQCIKRYLLSRI